MKNHIIIENAKKYNASTQPLTASGCTYDAKKGYWIEDSSNIAMMKSNTSNRPTTKKEDIETGEDQKGE